jgi:hypothetical protein
MNTGMPNVVADFLQFLRPCFAECQRPSRVYNHLGALLADVSLQAGVNYDHVVRPRVNYVLAEFPATATVSSLKTLILEIGVEQFLQWKGRAKIGVFTSILGTLDQRSIETVEDVSAWSSTLEANRILLGIRGFGYKSFDYLRLLCGFETIPIDRHLRRFLELAGVNCGRTSYTALQSILLEACEQIGLEPYKAEHGLWRLMRSCAP